MEAAVTGNRPIKHQTMPRIIRPFHGQTVATGFPAVGDMTSSPARAAFINCERRFLASKMFTCTLEPDQGR